MGLASAESNDLRSSWHGHSLLGSQGMKIRWASYNRYKYESTFPFRLKPEYRHEPR